MAKDKKHTGLGRGLDALIATDEVTTAGSSVISEIPLAQITPNPDQPRKDFDEEALHELAESIRTYGVIQPVTLRRTGDDSYQIVAGERRWRASGLAGLTSIPAYIKEVEDQSVLELALVENIQRSDLNPMEIALAYKGLIDELQITQDDLSERVGKNRATIANYLRLFKLPGEIQVALKNKEIDMGHARALLAVDDLGEQLRLFRQIREGGYSVRKVEEMVKEQTAKGKAEKGSRSRTSDPDYDVLQKHLATFFHTDVKLSVGAKGKGKISIPFKNEKELEGIIALLDKINKSFT
ncbi:MAG: ParB/RepB/Spo0J family partition protein [Bacteroidaceae bacterium]|jgi:ParB family chromosome partitioning protein|nr:ParB/RepB/Spo0J family partition protein [Bacteroidaceae bacterium]